MTATPVAVIIPARSSKTGSVLPGNLLVQAQSIFDIHAAAHLQRNSIAYTCGWVSPTAGTGL